MTFRIGLLVAAAAMGASLAACATATGDGFSDGSNDSRSDSGAPGKGETNEAGADANAGPPSATTAATRQLAPLSTSRVTSQKPTLHWKSDGVVGVEICSDRACTKPIGAVVDVAGPSYAPAAPLPAGVFYWRLHTASGVTATWQFTVGARSAPVDSSWGTTLDVNGDGFADVIVGAMGANDGNGAAYVYLGSATGLAATPVATLSSGDTAYASEGYAFSAASAGDVNGDGFADVIVGAYYYAGGAGKAYLYLGGATGLATTPAQTWSGTGTDMLGNSVASAGDVNGDGYADIIVGAPNASGGAGAAYVYFGGPTGASPTASKTFVAPDGLSDASDKGSSFGQWVGCAGDINGDGLSDVVVGAPAVWALIGRVYLYQGAADGPATSPTTVLTGTSTITTLGEAATTAGDINGDGFADLVVATSASSDNTGAVLLYFGSQQGLVTTSPTTILDGIVRNGTTFTVSAASAGDVNGDGFADLVVGKPLEGDTLQGIVYVYAGSASGISTEPTLTLTGTDGTQQAFGFSVASAGDIDGDTFSDVIIGANAWNIVGASVTDTNSIGAAHIFRGSKSGLASTASASLSGPSGRDIRFGTSVFGATN